MKFSYTPRGVCARQMEFEVEDGVLKNLNIIGGCHGNLQGIARLVEGMPIDEVISRLQVIRSRMKPTSCPVQIARAFIAQKEG